MHAIGFAAKVDAVKTSRLNTTVKPLLATLAIIPLKLSSSQMPFGGTTLLIIIGVGLQTVKEINTQLQQHHYEGFLK